MNKRCLIGLTGGIGTGKTTVSNYLATAYHLPVLDADVYAREAVQLGSPILDKIVKHYGAEIQLPSGNLNRQRLGEIVFSNPEQKRWLEEQIHPYVRDRFQSELATLTGSTVVLVIPLLFEAGLTNLVTEIWVVSCSAQQQLKRIQERNSLTLEQAQARINSQLPLTQKVALANVVLDNSSTVDALFKQVDVALNST